MAYPDSELAFRVVIPAEDLPDEDEAPGNDSEAITSTIVETASVLPNTKIRMTEEGDYLVGISQADNRRWSHIVEKVRQLTHNYEKILDRRQKQEKQSKRFDFENDPD